jgi:hypothetical protein
MVYTFNLIFYLYFDLTNLSFILFRRVSEGRGA